MWRLADEILKFEESGKILSRVREHVKGLPVGGMSVLNVCEEVERKICELGGGPAFPCNVGINEVAAHYTSPWNDKSVIPNDSVVKIDFGVEVDGCITDTSITLSLNPAYDSLVVAVETALEEAISAVAPGRKLSDVGGIIEDAITRYGFRPIRNLTGHKIERYTIHAGKSIPNVRGLESGRFEVGEIYAIEPFATYREADGVVRERMPAYIFRFARMKGMKTAAARKLAADLQTRYRSLPFASRWVLRNRGENEIMDEEFMELMESKVIAGYPVLVETSGAIVTQAEHTVLVTDDGCRVLTV